MTTQVADAPSVRPLAPRKLSRLEKARLAGEVITGYFRARRALAGTSLPTALDELRAGARADDSVSPEPETLVEAVRLGQVVVRVLRPLPVESRCLMRSLVLTGLLARRGIGSRLVIGVKGGEKFGAHAWVELDRQAVLPAGSNEFERLVDL